MKKVLSLALAIALGTSPIALYAAPGYLKRAGLPKVPADLAAHQCLRDHRDGRFVVDDQQAHDDCPTSVRCL